MPWKNSMVYHYLRGRHGGSNLIPTTENQLVAWRRWGDAEHTDQMVIPIMSAIENKAISAVSENEGDNAGKEGKINDSYGLVNEQLFTYDWDGNFL